MTPQELHDLLILRGYPSFVRGEEVVIRTCWFCGNDRSNLELNPSKGVYSCWACRASDRLDRLLNDRLGTDFQIPVDFERAPGLSSPLPPSPEFESSPAFEVPSALRYLEHRGISEEVIRVYDLRVCLEEGNPLYGRIVIPLRDFFSMDFLGWVGRAYSGEHPRYQHTLPRRKICGYRMRDRSTPIILVEGVFDGIVVHRAGFQAAILLGTSSPEIEEFAARIPPDSWLGIILDGSARLESQRLFWRIQPVHRKVFAIDLPPEIDPGGLLPSSLRKLVERSLERRS